MKIEFAKWNFFLKEENIISTVTIVVTKSVGHKSWYISDITGATNNIIILIKWKVS